MKMTQISFTKRIVLAGVLAGSGLLAASSFAMSPGGMKGNGDCGTKHGQKTQAQRSEMRMQKMTALKAKLKLSAQQEVAWNTFANQPQVEMGGDRKAMRAEFATLTTPQRMDKMLEMSEKRRAQMLARAEATKTFYAQLSPAQQSVFDAEARNHRHHGGESHPS